MKINMYKRLAKQKANELNICSIIKFSLENMDYLPEFKSAHVPIECRLLGINASIDRYMIVKLKTGEQYKIVVQEMLID